MKVKFIANTNTEFYNNIVHAFSDMSPYIMEYIKYSLNEVKPVYNNPDTEKADKVLFFFTVYNWQNINEELAKLFLSLDVINKVENNPEIVLVAPFLPYTRQDKALETEPDSFLKLLEQFKNHGITKVLTWDLHNQTFVDNNTLPVLIKDLYSTEPLCNILIQLINDTKASSLLLIAPDKGAENMVTTLAEDMKEYVIDNFNISTAICNKTRLPDRTCKTDIPAYIADCNGIAIICDDIIDTGNTIFSIMGRFPGFKETKILASHGILNTQIMQILYNYIVSDSILNSTSEIIPSDKVYTIWKEFYTYIAANEVNNADMPNMSKRV